MPVPTYDKFIEPTLRYLAQHADEVIPAGVVHDAVADALGLSDADRAELLQSGVQQVYKNRAGWAHDRLKRAGLSSSIRRGHWQITENGRKFADKRAGAFSAEIVERLAKRYSADRPRQASADDAGEPCPVPSTSPTSIESPDEALEAALQQIKESVAHELLELVWAATPQFFETLVLDLLHAMGYGTSRAALQRVGGAGDGGIDGIISLDSLGLEKVYVQAKKYAESNSVGRPDVQGFYGAIAGQRANKGVFITSSRFTTQAEDFARSVEGIVLVDGNQLASLMIEHGIGVSPRMVRVPKLDTDYFET